MVRSNGLQGQPGMDSGEWEAQVVRIMKSDRRYGIEARLVVSVLGRLTGVVVTFNVTRSERLERGLHAVKAANRSSGCWGPGGRVGEPSAGRFLGASALTGPGSRMRAMRLGKARNPRKSRINRISSAGTNWNCPSVLLSQGHDRWEDETMGNAKRATCARAGQGRSW